MNARKTLATHLHKRGWAYDVDLNGLRRRIYCLAMERYPWWDWGHHLMILVGRDFCGNWDEPRPDTWWYRRGPSKRMRRTGFPRHPVSSFTVLTDWEAMRAATDGLNEDEMYEWQAIGVNQDGDLHLGHQYWGGTFHDLRRDEWPLLRRWLRHAHRRDWFGLRSWLYAQGLHAAVHRKKPWTCQAQPPRGQGGYDHWYCGLPRKHAGMHRFNNYRWGDVGGELVGTFYDPDGCSVNADKRIIHLAICDAKYRANHGGAPHPEPYWVDVADWRRLVRSYRLHRSDQRPQGMRSVIVWALDAAGAGEVTP